MAEMELLMKRASLLIFTMVIVSAPDSLPAGTGMEILKQIDSNMLYEQRTANATMTIVRPNRNPKVMEMTIYSEGLDKAAIEFTAPAREKGTRFLKLEDNLWIYMPSTEKVMKISGHMLRQSMMGSDFSYEDSVRNESLEDLFLAELEGEEKVNGRQCHVIRLSSKKQNVSYPHQRLWVDKEWMIPVKEDLMALSGKVIKEVELGEVRQVDGRNIPTRIVMRDLLRKDSSTEVVLKDIRFGLDLSEDLVFTRRWLERGR
jgi:outer membrane lipoprotein-sorting protein